MSESTRRISKFWLPVLALAFGTMAALAQEHCDLRVHLFDTNGTRADARVQARSKGGEVIAEVNSQGGVAELCDIGFGKFDLVIKNLSCETIVFPNLQAMWPYGIERKVFLHPCGGDWFLRKCALLLRVVDEAGRPLAGAQAHLGAKSVWKPSDTKGRIWWIFGFGDRVSGQIVKTGFEPGDFSFTCGEDQIRTELRIQLMTVARGQ